MIAKELIKLHEGLELKPYRCTAGKLTIGYGRNIEDRGISEVEAEFMLDSDIINCVNELRANFDWYEDLDEVRKAVLIDMCYNLGWSRFSQFKLMLSAVERGDYRTAAKEMLDSRWATQVGDRATRLANIMATGDWAY